jgi:hypothetical protein
MCPQTPRLSPEYSYKAGLQTVITGMPLQIRLVTRSGHVGPITMGRIVRGPPSWTRPHSRMTSSQAFVWCRIERRVSLPVLSPSDQRLQRRPRAKGGVFAFAPTVGMNEKSRSLGKWVTRLVGKDVQPLQSLKLVYQPCSRSWATWTLTWLIYGIKLNMSFALPCGFYY